MPSRSFHALVETYLQPVLVRAGFSEGQWCDDPARGSSVIFCAAGDDYVRRHPDLVDDGDHWANVYCVDITIEGSLQRGVVQFEVEVESLADLLARTGHDRDADVLPSLLQLDHPDEDFERLAGVLTRLYHDDRQSLRGRDSPP